MPISTRLFPPLSLKEVLEELASFKDEEFKLFLDETLTSAAFDSSQERCEAVAKKLNKDPGLLGFLFGALDFLYREVRQKAKDDKTLRLLVDELLESLEITSTGKTDVKLLSDRLVRLLSFNENAERRDKVGRLIRGFLPNAIGFSSFVDLRPNFDAKRTKILELFRLCSSEFRTVTQDEEEEFLLFQLDERALEKLREALDDVENKLDGIKSDAISLRIMR